MIKAKLLVPFAAALVITLLILPAQVSAVDTLNGRISVESSNLNVGSNQFSVTYYNNESRAVTIHIINVQVFDQDPYNPREMADIHLFLGSEIITPNESHTFTNDLALPNLALGTCTVYVIMNGAYENETRDSLGAFSAEVEVTLGVGSQISFYSSMALLLLLGSVALVLGIVVVLILLMKPRGNVESIPRCKNCGEKSENDVCPKCGVRIR